MPLLTPLQQTIVAAATAAPGQLTRSGLAKLLTGAVSTRMAEWTAHPEFGRLKAYPRKTILHEIDVLLHLGVLTSDAHDRVRATEGPTSHE